VIQKIVMVYHGFNQKQAEQIAEQPVYSGNSQAGKYHVYTYVPKIAGASSALFSIFLMEKQ
jgi:hypothetical protein